MESFGEKKQGLLQSLGIFEDFGGFFEGLEWFRTYL
jgi:hypothetical protein